MILGMLPRGLGVRNLIFQTEGIVSSDELMVTGITNNLEQNEVECFLFFLKNRKTLQYFIYVSFLDKRKLSQQLLKTNSAWHGMLTCWLLKEEVNRRPEAIDNYPYSTLRCPGEKGNRCGCGEEQSLHSWVFSW